MLKITIEEDGKPVYEAESKAICGALIDSSNKKDAIFYGTGKPLDLAWGMSEMIGSVLGSIANDEKTLGIVSDIAALHIKKGAFGEDRGTP